MAHNDDEHNNNTRLNPLSERFDAELALQQPLAAFRGALPTERDRVVFDRAQAVDNVAACAHLQYAPFRVLTPSPLSVPPSAPSCTKRAREASQRAPRGEQRRAGGGDGGGGGGGGVLRRLHEKAAANGPLRLLARAVRERLVLRIRVRERHCIRGVVEGVALAFDRHMNVVLRNAVIRDRGVDARAAKQLLVRGENIVLISIAN